MVTFVFYFSTPQAAEVLGVSQRKVAAFCAKRLIRARKMKDGTRPWGWYMTTRALLDFIRRKRQLVPNRDKSLVKFIRKEFM